ncbi:serine/arginine repetitive matrix protein 1-like [Triticum dicoccoides]|uniref:serine/arginine repetitive matrix protein 1-like n=1 Tax=Triticum dicoccoides TaxID=85692 RepID=UPI0018911C12|nr:serine/arginine repetitive matrix protein 1-like [Triticum dicoccoides]
MAPSSCVVPVVRRRLAHSPVSSRAHSASPDPGSTAVACSRRRPQLLAGPGPRALLPHLRPPPRRPAPPREPPPPRLAPPLRRPLLASPILLCIDLPCAKPCHRPTTSPPQPELANIRPSSTPWGRWPWTPLLHRRMAASPRASSDYNKRLRDETPSTTTTGDLGPVKYPLDVPSSTTTQVPREHLYLYRRRGSDKYPYNKCTSTAVFGISKNVKHPFEMTRPTSSNDPKYLSENEMYTAIVARIETDKSEDASATPNHVRRPSQRPM